MIVVSFIQTFIGVILLITLNTLLHILHHLSLLPHSHLLSTTFGHPYSHDYYYIVETLTSPDGHLSFFFPLISLCLCKHLAKEDTLFICIFQVIQCRALLIYNSIHRLKLFIIFLSLASNSYDKNTSDHDSCVYSRSSLFLHGLKRVSIVQQ